MGFFFAVQPKCLVGRGVAKLLQLMCFCADILQLFGSDRTNQNLGQTVQNPPKENQTNGHSMPVSVVSCNVARCNRTMHHAPAKRKKAAFFAFNTSQQ
mmetsp:Transcript_40792/g.73024  ORF Transcript_40792/g.73024 Transcript_40792/m.73024 type:complete len:98 (+) Transcript_40792:498-791(+)